MVRVMPFVRLNSVMVITPRAHYLDRMETWIERLDRAPENGARTQPVCVPRTEHHAGRLAMLLNSIYCGGGSGAKEALRQSQRRAGIESGVGGGWRNNNRMGYGGIAAVGRFVAVRRG